MLDTDMPQESAEEAIVQSVNDRYGYVAINASKDQGEASLYQNFATAFGYTEAELQSVPDGANLGLSCGNPIGLANLRQVTALPPAGIEACNTDCVVTLGRGRDRPWMWWWLRRFRRSAKDWKAWPGNWGGYERRLLHPLRWTLDTTDMDLPSPSSKCSSLHAEMLRREAPPMSNLSRLLLLQFR